MNFDEGTEVLHSCGATLNGQHWIIGGDAELRQVSFRTNGQLNECHAKKNKWWVFR